MRTSFQWARRAVVMDVSPWWSFFLCLRQAAISLLHVLKMSDRCSDKLDCSSVGPRTTLLSMLNDDIEKSWLFSARNVFLDTSQFMLNEKSGVFSARREQFPSTFPVHVATSARHSTEEQQWRVAPMCCMAEALWPRRSVHVTLEGSTCSTPHGQASR